MGKGTISGKNKGKVGRKKRLKRLKKLQSKNKDERRKK